ncbi:hypothetical protein ABGB07_18445 [Micromonosporaceae bacterium B7E4]
MLERVVARLARDVADLDTEAARSILVAADALHGKTIRQIGAYLDARPDALLAGVSDCPIGLLRVINNLIDAGYAVAAPTCASCGRAARHLRNAPDGRLCYRCAARTTRRTCERCGRVGRPAARRVDGVICYSCYQRDSEVVEECAACGRRRRPVRRLADGTGLCDTCHERP